MNKLSCLWQHINILSLYGLVAVFLLQCSGCNEKQVTTKLRSDKAISDVTTLLVTIPENDKPPEKNAVTANHAPKGALVDFFFSDNGSSVAYSVRDVGYSYVSCNGKPGKVYKADVMPVVLSADGKHSAFGAQDGGSYRMVVDAIEGDTFKQVKNPVFSPDDRHVAYTASKDGIWGLVVDSKWHAGKSSQMQELLLFSGDSSRIAYVDEVVKDYAGRLVVSDLKFREQKIIAPAGVSTIVSNGDKTKVAAGVSAEGKQKVISFSFANPGDLKAGPVYDSVSNLVFAPNGVSLAYTAEKAGIKYIVLNDREDVLGAGRSVSELPVVLPDLKGVGVIIVGKDQKQYLQEFFVRTTKEQKRYDKVSFLTYNNNGVAAFAAASRAKNAWFTVVDGKEGPPYDRVVTPHFSPDGKYLVYRARKDGKRFVVVADASGKVLRQHPAYDQVFDVQFIPGGKSVAYGVKDGNKLIWKVEAL